MESEGNQSFSSLAPDKDTPGGCAAGSGCFCCGFRSKEASGRCKEASHPPAVHGDAAMAPSAPITFVPPLPSPGFGSSDRLVAQSNGCALGSTQKLPGKSNLKHKTSIPSNSHPGNGSSTMDGKDRFGESEDIIGERVQGQGERGTKVQWLDNYGKDLTEVFEFEPSSDSDDSEDSDDEDSSQACTCVIQ